MCICTLSIKQYQIIINEYYDSDYLEYIEYNL